MSLSSLYGKPKFGIFHIELGKILLHGNIASFRSCNMDHIDANFEIDNSIMLYLPMVNYEHRELSKVQLFDSVF